MTYREHNAVVVNRTKRIHEIAEQLRVLNAQVTELIRECLAELSVKEAEAWLREELNVDFSNPNTADFVDAEIVAAHVQKRMN